VKPLSGGFLLGKYNTNDTIQLSISYIYPTSTIEVLIDGRTYSQSLQRYVTNAQWNYLEIVIEYNNATDKTDLRFYGNTRSLGAVNTEVYYLDDTADPGMFYVGSEFVPANSMTMYMYRFRYYTGIGGGSETWDD
jgi:hypothetical protein